MSVVQGPWPPPSSADETPLQSGDGGGTFNGMEARVKRLEDDMREVKTDLKTLIRDVSEIKGRVANMPSTWQMIGISAGLIGIVIASGGGLLAILRLMAPAIAS